MSRSVCLPAIQLKFHGRAKTGLPCIRILRALSAQNIKFDNCLRLRCMSTQLPVLPPPILKFLVTCRTGSFTEEDAIAIGTDAGSQLKSEASGLAGMFDW